MLTIVTMLYLSTGLACSTHETTKETATVNLIDYGRSIKDGVKIADSSEVAFVIYKNGEFAGKGSQSFNGQMVLPPSRYWQLISNEATLAEVAFLSSKGGLVDQIKKDLGIPDDVAITDSAINRWITIKQKAIADKVDPDQTDPGQ